MILADWETELQQHLPGLTFVSPLSADLAAATNGGVERARLADLDEEIPQWWVEACSSEDPDQRKAVIMARWELVTAERLPRSYAQILGRLYDVALVEIDQRYALLYGILCSDSLTFYVGGNPFDEVGRAPQDVPWMRLPDGLREFYTLLHDGFTEFSTGRMGLVSVRQATALSGRVCLFTNGSDGYLTIDTEDPNLAHLVLPGMDDEVHPFWDLLDQWMSLGISSV